MAIKPYLIEVIGIDLWHAVEFSRYGRALIWGFRSISRQPATTPKGRRRNLGHPRPQGQIRSMTAQKRRKIEKTLIYKGFLEFLGKFFLTNRPCCVRLVARN